MTVKRSVFAHLCQLNTEIEAFVLSVVFIMDQLVCCKMKHSSTYSIKCKNKDKMHSAVKPNVFVCTGMSLAQCVLNRTFKTGQIVDANVVQFIVLLVQSILCKFGP